MIPNDAEEEIEAILRGIIGVLEAWSLTRQTGKKKEEKSDAICPQLQEQFLQGSTQCRSKERTQIARKETGEEILLTPAVPRVMGPIKFVVVMVV